MDLSSLKITSIRTKVLLVMVLIPMLAIFFISTALVINEKHTAHRNLIKELFSIADVIALNSGESIAFNDREAALETLISLAARKGIVAAFLYDANFIQFEKYVGNGAEADKMMAEFYKSHPDRVVAMEQLLESGMLIAACPQGKHVHIIRPVRLNGNVVGAIHLVNDMRNMNDSLLSYYRVIGITIAFTLLWVFLLAAWLQKYITVPLFDLMRSMNLVTRDKNYSVRVINRSNDELGTLIDHFNVMIGEIQSRDQELQEYSQRLEKMVESRTAELYSANTELEAMIEDIGKK